MEQTRCNCLALRQATRRVTQYYDQMLAPTGLRTTQYSILMHLLDQPLAMKTLAQAMVMDRATLGHNLRPIEAQGLVKLTVGSDRRSRLVSLTPAGRKRLAEATIFWRKAQRGFEAIFGPADSSDLRTRLGQVARLDLEGIA
jgi:DNA-binding MarR family transcriptional regulator